MTTRFGITLKAAALALGVVSVTLSAAPMAQAAVLIEKGLDLTGFGWNSNLSGRSQQFTDDVTMADDSIVRTASWFGFRGNDIRTFTLRFYDDVAEGVNTTPFYEDVVTATAVDTGQLRSGYKVYEYSADIRDIRLFADTRYELSILANTSDTWTWSFSSVEPGTQYYRSGDSGQWRGFPVSSRSGQGGSQAFSLHGDLVAPVPVPAALPLLLAGLGGLGLMARRRTISGRG